MANVVTSNNKSSRMLTVRETSHLLHIHPNTLRRWSQYGIIRAYRIGPRGDRRFKPEDVAALFEEREGSPADKRGQEDAKR
jgi:excisionase family DNA binding protein